MRLGQLVLIVAVALALSGCGSKFKRYHGPEVTQVYIFKGMRKMYLMHGAKALKVYDIDLGYAPTGHKQFSGDGRTPEGAYFIDKRNPDSKYHLSVGISYPNAADIEVARALNKDPGGDIFIHGQLNGYQVLTADWTAGCIAVQNEEIEEIYSMVNDGTPITIYP